MTDTAIIGGGLGGLILARELAERGHRPGALHVFDASTPERASDVPVALLHPFPGRSMDPKPGQMTAARASVDLLRAVRSQVGRDAILEIPMIRPLIGKMGERLLSTWEAAKDDYPDWFASRVVEGEELAQLEPAMEPFERALVYEPAFSVDVRRLTAYLRQSLERAGVELRQGCRVESLSREGGRWDLACADGDTHRTDRVVLAVGWQMRRWFPELSMRGRGGEMLVARPPEDEALGAIINASGHVAPRADGGWAAGSTYWSPEEFSSRTARKARLELIERCERLTPGLADAKPLEIWRGVRAMYRGDNRPLVGPVPGLDGLFAFSAFGSKGLLRIPWLARQLSEAMLGGDAVAASASTERTDRAAWKPSARIDG